MEKREINKKEKIYKIIYTGRVMFCSDMNEHVDRDRSEYDKIY